MLDLTTECPVCGGKLHRHTRPVSYTYSGQTLVVEQPGLFCDECGDGVLEPADLAATRHMLLLLLDSSERSAQSGWLSLDEAFDRRPPMNETTLTSWYLITFYDAPESTRILWGTVQDDPSGRWGRGDWCSTSVVLDQTGDNVYVTKNTKYTLIGPGQNVELPLETLWLLRKGMSPGQIGDGSHVTLEDLERAGLLPGSE